MPVLSVNGTKLDHTLHGTGEPVVMVTGTGGRARSWNHHQVPALVGAGCQVVTFDNRGTPPSEAAPASLTLDDMVRDTAGLIEELRLGPCRIVGLSLGALIAQELALSRPDLLSGAVFMATRGRTDTLRRAMTVSEADLTDSTDRVPAAYDAVARAVQNLSRRTLADPSLQDWLDIFEMAPIERDAAYQAQLRSTLIPDRLRAYREIRVPSMVLAFADDLVTPPELCREVADAIEGCRYTELPDCGHLGHLERPDAVNAALLDFLQDGGAGR